MKGRILKFSHIYVGLLGLALSLASAGLAQWSGNPPILPDAKITPGDTLDVTKDDICVPGYSKKVRNVPKTVKDQAYANYGIKNHLPGEYEVDHLISLELGGSNSIKNLWPQSYKTQPWNAHVKDALENRLHKDVCDGSLDLKVAQQDIAKDWIAAYKKYFHKDLPVSKGGRNVAASKTNSAPPAEAKEQVWVNLRSGIFWRPGAQYYGKTKQGKYMTEAEAVNAGYRAAKGQ